MKASARRFVALSNISQGRIHKAQKNAKRKRHRTAARRRLRVWDDRRLEFISKIIFPFVASVWSVLFNMYSMRHEFLSIFYNKYKLYSILTQSLQLSNLLSTLGNAKKSCWNLAFRQKNIKVPSSNLVQKYPLQLELFKLEFPASTKLINITLAILKASQSLWDSPLVRTWCVIHCWDDFL